MSSTPREAFLPVDLDELALELAARATDRGRFERFALRYAALGQARLAESTAELRRAYRTFDPDRDTVAARVLEEDEKVRLREVLRGRLAELLRQANFVEIPRQGLDAALTRVSPRGLAVSVDLDEFEELSLHFRGEYTRRDSARDWRRLGLGVREFDTTVYRRLFLFLKPRPAADEGPVPERVYLKLFRDVPESDLEMLLPNTRVRMRVFDKVKLGVTGGGGTAGGVAATVTKIGAAANPTTWAVALAGLAAVVWRQISKVLAQRTRYMADLAQQLYYQNLDNNYGALTHLAEQAQMEESKEAILAFAFLTERGPLRREELDRAVEEFLRERYGFDADYEVDDGIEKLRRAELLVERGDDRLETVAVERALAQLDEEWDGMYGDEPRVTADAPA